MPAFEKYLWYARTLLRRPFFGHIGSMSFMGRPVFLYGRKGIFLGDKVRIMPGCRLETHNGGELHIGTNTSIGQNFHCTAGGVLNIGADCTFSGNVVVTDIDHQYREIDRHILEQPMLVSETSIGDNCFIGFGAVIQAGTRLGRQCVVGANAVVRGSYPDYCVLAGVPAKIIRQYNPGTGEWERVGK